MKPDPFYAFCQSNLKKTLIQSRKVRKRESHDMLPSDPIIGRLTLYRICVVLFMSSNLSNLKPTFRNYKQCAQRSMITSENRQRLFI